MFELGVVSEVFGVDRTEDGVPGHRLPRLLGAPGRADRRWSTASPSPPPTGWRTPTAPTSWCAGLRLRLPASEAGARRLPPGARPRRLGALGLHGRLPARRGRPARRPRRAPPTGGTPTSSKRRFPQATVDPDVLFVEDDRVITSAGTAAGHRRLPAPRGAGARRRGGQPDRPADGGAAAARRRPGQYIDLRSRPATPRRLASAADLDREHLDEEHRCECSPRRPACRSAPSPAGSRRDRHHAGQVAARTSGCCTPRTLLESTDLAVETGRRRGRVRHRPRCCATTSAHTWASRRPSTGARSAPRTCAPADPLATSVGAMTYPPAPWNMHGQLWLSLFRVREGDHPDRPAGVYGAALVSYEQPSPLTYSELLVARPVEKKVDHHRHLGGLGRLPRRGRDLWAIPKDLCDFRLDNQRRAAAAHVVDRQPRGGRSPEPGSATSPAHAAHARSREPRGRSAPEWRGQGRGRADGQRQGAALPRVRGSSTRQGRSPGWQASDPSRRSGWPTSRCPSARTRAVE